MHFLLVFDTPTLDGLGWELPAPVGSAACCGLVTIKSAQSSREQRPGSQREPQADSWMLGWPWEPRQDPALFRPQFLYKMVKDDGDGVGTGMKFLGPLLGQMCWDFTLHQGL